MVSGKCNTILIYFLTCETYVLSQSFYNFLLSLNVPNFHDGMPPYGSLFHQVLDGAGDTLIKI